MIRLVTKSLEIAASGGLEEEDQQRGQQGATAHSREPDQ
jgi:hypothetical protein